MAAGGSARRAAERAMGADETGPLAAAPAGPDALEEAGAEVEAVAPGEDSYAAQLETVRRLRASGASAEAVRAAAARLKELKRGTYEKLPRGTVGRRKKRRAALDAGVDVLDVEKAIAKRDAPAVATYPPVDVPPTDAEGFVVAFDARTVFLSEKTKKASRAHDSNTSSVIVDAESDADLAFFARYGFVVYENVLSPEECAATRDEIFGELERVYGDASVQEDTAVSSSNVKRQTKHTVGFKRDDFKTYVALPIETYGLAPDPAVFTPRCVANRQNETVAKCLARVLHVADPSEDLLVSHDRWCVFRPTRDVPGVGDRPDWKTRANLHLDLNPWTYGAATETEATRMTRDADDETLSGRADALDAGGTRSNVERSEFGEKRDDDDAPSSLSVAETLTFETLRDFSRETNCVEARTGPHCQGVLMLAENRAEDGGLQVVPGFHAVFERWVRDGLRGDPSRFADAHDDWRRSRLVARAGGAGSFKFGDDDAEIQKRAFRVAAREGSYVVWDQRLAHGTAPNDSSRARVAQFVKGFRKSKVSAGRLARRAERVRLEIGKAGAETQAAVSELGRKLFGLQ